MTKKLCLTLVLITLICALCGCARQTVRNPFKADNEIVTYKRIDDKKTQLVVARAGNIEVKKLCRAFEARNPDVQVVYLDITGGNKLCKPIVDWIKNGYAPDVLFAATGFFSEDEIVNYFTDLSGNPTINHYQTAALQRTSTKGKVYFLPGPSNINAMMYNKTLFERYGWEVPKTFDEFIALCSKITEDTNGEVVPWNPNAKYSNELLNALEGFVYEELLGGGENRLWYNSFTEGKAAFKGHMEPFYDMVQKLIDNGLLTEEFFKFSATTRDKEFRAGKIAMINCNIFDMDNNEFDYGYIPFPTTVGDIGYLCDSYSCLVGVPIKEHSEEKLKIINEFLEYFSSSEGQTVYIGDGVKFSNVKGVEINQDGDCAALEPAISAGHVFERMEFIAPTGTSLASLYNDAYKLMSGKATAAECIAANDSRKYAQAAASKAEPENVLASAPKDMTILETSLFIADAYRAITDADIGLIVNNEVYRGNVMRVFAGDITPSFVTVLKPRSFANDSVLIKASMTGAQLLDALNAPPLYTDEVSDGVYACSGLKCEIAPWGEVGSKYPSVKLADGGAIQPDALYTVAMWSGTVKDEYITEVLESREGTWESIMTEYITEQGTVTAACDGRVKLVWE